MGVGVGLSEEFLVVVLFLALRDLESLAEGLLMGVPDPVPVPDDFLSDSQRDLRSEGGGRCLLMEDDFGLSPAMFSVSATSVFLAPRVSTFQLLGCVRLNC